MAKQPAIPTILSVTCFLRSGSDVLLMKRGSHKTHEPNKFCGVGGKVDLGETILGAAIRETEEETGLRLDPTAFKFRGELIMDGYPEGRWLVSLFEAWTDNRAIHQADEGELSWISIDEAPTTDLMDDIQLYVTDLLHSTELIFGYFQFDDQQRVIAHTLDHQRLPALEVSRG